MEKIALVIPWFGQLKNYNDFWFKSLESNPTVDFFLITDQVIKGFTPPNLIIVNKSFTQVIDEVQACFDFKVCIPQSYKLCDFRVAYGEIFSSYLKDYDFWGYCDNDLIFGDIRKFVTKDILQRYDRILSHGHFSLFRNVSAVNEIYKKASPSYKEVFSTPKNYCYDEWPGTSGYWFENCCDRFYNGKVYDDIYYLKHAFITTNKKELDKGRKNFVYLFDKGSLYRYFEEDGKVSREETMYVHFQKRNLEVKTKVSDIFVVVPNMILPVFERLKRCVIGLYRYLWVNW